MHSVFSRTVRKNPLYSREQKRSLSESTALSPVPFKRFKEPRLTSGVWIRCLASVCYIFLSGRFDGYQPFGILVTDDVIASGFPLSIIGMALIIAVWGFFEGFNYAVISEKINRRYPSKNQWLDYGALTCGIVCILFHPISISFWGMIEIITTFAAVYGMLIVRKKTENAWGCVFAFCFIWNAL